MIVLFSRCVHAPARCSTSTCCLDPAFLINMWGYTFDWVYLTHGLHFYQSNSAGGRAPRQTTEVLVGCTWNAIHISSNPMLLWHGTLGQNRILCVFVCFKHICIRYVHTTENPFTARKQVQVLIPIIGKMLKIGSNYWLGWLSVDQNSGFYACQITLMCSSI